LLVGITPDAEIELLTYDVSCDKLLFGGKPLAADALFGRFLPDLAACGNAGGLFNVPAYSPPLCMPAVARKRASQSGALSQKHC
jgi:hypothetical protein